MRSRSCYDTCIRMSGCGIRLSRRCRARVWTGHGSARFGRPLTVLSPDFGAKTADLCNTNDPVCSRGDDFDAHVRYPQSGLVKLAAQWITKHVEQRV